ncbi:cAMP-binding protein [Leptospira gomenensis]|uniref:cAMP-binding protein n=1 Tax=Leptospira gomenensis TaxID=2484974 RepID=A0A5F1YLU8_9LEPT|nr:tetratricopeptide repeat protein [Leptospira gomenensis]TGK32683.1 cAMP-binding protein [Leptospira gomenensis]TGK36831.1 cAMP-binding protein [Leptospira gomenensis]TGK39906.1 cAMP-binding protein [Leptospira gomenensis]TGK58041.1 cAMP-binding protein [Leptospira gomenensis]
MAGPIIRNYKGGSIIYFEKDKAEDIYVLRNGRVILTFPAVDTGQEVKEDVRIGEFFGVKSALGKYPREETAQVIGSATVLVFKPNEFEQFVAEKTHLILKMMKVFSSQLRQVHKKLKEILGQSDTRNPAFELMNVAEVFYKNNNLPHAVYAFEKYLQHYPGSTYTGRATELLELARRGSPYPLNMPPLVYEGGNRVSQETLQNIMKPAVEKSAITQGVDNSITSLYNRAHTLVNVGKHNEAMVIYKDLLNRTDFKFDSEKKLVENALFQLGGCFLKQNELDNANSSFSTYIKKYPSGESIKESLFHLAEIAELQGDRQRARMLYGKVALLPPEKDSISQKSRLKAKEMST